MVNVMSSQAVQDVSGIETDVAISQPSRQKEEEEAPRWRVLLVDDHPIVRQMFRDILESYPDIDVVGEASDGEEAVALAQVYRPNLILMDINLPKKSGFEATRLITRNLADTVVIGISGQYSPHHYNLMMCAGAVAFVRKEDATELLHKTILFSMGSYSHRHSPFRATWTMGNEKSGYDR